MANDIGSGSPNSVLVSPGDLQEGKEVTERFMQSAGIQSLQEAYSLPPWAMLWGQGQDQYDIEFPGYWIDGWLAPEHPHFRLIRGDFIPDALILGANSRDGVLGKAYISPKDLPTTAPCPMFTVYLNVP